MSTENHALKRYNSLFDNDQYSAIAHHLAHDLNLSRDSFQVSDMMNEITNTALTLCNHSQYADSWLKLATVCGQNTVSTATIEAIHRYLLIYQQVGDTRADDFELTAKSLQKAYEVMPTLKAMVSYTNGVHGWRGRMAYDLIVVSDLLVQVAVQLLIHGNLSYIREKLQLGLKRIIGALHEGLRHSERPEQFDFSAFQLPPKQD